MKMQFYRSIETNNIQNRLICGFTFNENNPILCEEQYNILSTLSKNEKLKEYSSFNILDDQ